MCRIVSRVCTQIATLINSTMHCSQKAVVGMPWASTTEAMCLRSRRYDGELPVYPMTTFLSETPIVIPLLRTLDSLWRAAALRRTGLL
jgi:hypothetical protein